MTAGTPRSSLDRSHSDGTEVERKFLVPRLPDDLASFPSDRIAQGYLSLDPAGAQVRLRRRGYHTLLTVKSGRGLARAEEEFVIDGAALASGRARAFLDACGVAAAAAEAALAGAERVAAEWGGAVLRVNGGAVDALRPPADLQAAVAG